MERRPHSPLSTAPTPGNCQLPTVNCQLVSVLLFEIAVLENVRSSPDEAEADIVGARIAERELGAPEHHDLVGLPMIAAMHDFINTGFADRIAGPHLRAMGSRTTPRTFFGWPIGGTQSARPELKGRF